MDKSQNVLGMLEMIKDGLAQELAGLNPEEPERALRYACSLLKEWAEKIEKLLDETETQGGETWL